MLSYTEGDVTINGIAIHYYRTGGDKPPFALLHGATDNGLCWTPVAAELANNYDVIMVDAQGHGKSGRLDPDFAHTSHADQVAGLLKELGIQKPVIMGHSMGAGTTVDVAVRYPDLPKAIILEDPVWQDPLLPGAAPSEEEQKVRDGFARMLESYGQMTVEEIAAQGKKDNPAWSDEELGPWAASKKQFDPTLFERLRIDAPTYEELVPQIKVPTLLITSDGGIVLEAVAEKAQRLWKSDKPFTWVRIEGAGHNIRREQYGEFMAAVRRFLGSLAA